MQAAAEEARMIAKRRMFYGEPCERCGLTLRYRKTRNCVACSRSRAKYDPALRRQRDNRALAMDAGATRYEGRPCKKCSGRMYYTRNAHCVQCDREQQKKRPRRFNPTLQQHRDNRAAARAVGLKTFDGTPCKKCGTSIRYVSNKNCVRCQCAKPRTGWRAKRRAA